MSVGAALAGKQYELQPRQPQGQLVMSHGERDGWSIVCVTCHILLPRFDLVGHCGSCAVTLTEEVTYCSLRNSITNTSIGNTSLLSIQLVLETIRSRWRPSTVRAKFNQQRQLLPQQSQSLCRSICMGASGHRSLHPRLTKKVASTHLRKLIPSLSY